MPHQYLCYVYLKKYIVFKLRETYVKSLNNTPVMSKNLRVNVAEKHFCAKSASTPAMLIMAQNPM